MEHKVKKKIRNETVHSKPVQRQASDTIAYPLILDQVVLFYMLK